MGLEPVCDPFPLRSRSRWWSSAICKGSFSLLFRPILFHQLRALSEVGVKQVILAVSYMPQQMVDAIPTIKKDVGLFQLVEV